MEHREMTVSIQTCRRTGGNVKTAYSVRGSDGVWFVDEFKQNVNLGCIKIILHQVFVALQLVGINRHVQTSRIG